MSWMYDNIRHLEIHEDGLTYRITTVSEDTCVLNEIEFEDPYVKDIEVPPEIGGYKVTEITCISYKPLIFAEMIIIPYGVCKVHGLLCGPNLITSIRFPETVKYIDAGCINATLRGVRHDAGIYGSIDIAHDCRLENDLDWMNSEQMFSIYRRNKGEILYRGSKDIKYSYHADPSGYGIILTHYWATDPDPVIPPYIHGNRVVGLSCFEWGYAKSLTLPDTITDIYNLHGIYKYIKLPKSLLRIGRFSVHFTDPDNYTLELPESLELLANNAFEGSNIKKVKLPSSMLDIKTAFNNTYIEEIVIPHGISAVKKDAFKDCLNLKRVVFSDTVKSIGNGAFRNCISLTEVVLPDGLLHIDDLAFEGCTSLKKVVMGNNVISIGKGAFWGAAALEEINLPQSLKSIGRAAFNGCSSLHALSIPDSVTMLPEYFCAGSGIADIDIPASVTVIDKHAFADCKQLENIKLPEGLVYLGMMAFKDSGLRSVEIPGSLKHILSLTFMDCVSLKDIYLHDGTVIIEDEAFSGAREVNKVIVPDSVEYVGAGVLLSKKYNYKNFKRLEFRSELVKPMRRYPNDMIILMYLTKLFFDKKEEESFCRVADNTDVTEADLAFYEEFKERMNSFINYGINIALPVDDRNRLRNWSHYIKPQGTYTEELRDCGWKMFRDYSEWMDMHKHTLADLLRGEHTSIEYETPTGPMVLNDAVLDPSEKPDADGAEH